MNIENPLAFSFILQEDLFLLNSDKASINNIKASLPQISPPVNETQALNFNYLGENKKNFLVMTYYPQSEFMTDKHLAALESTLKRLDVSIEDVALLNKANYTDAAIGHLVDFFSPQKLLILGLNALPADIGAIALNKLQHLNNCHTLLTFSFDEMMDNTEFKKAFWEQMKQL